MIRKWWERLRQLSKQTQIQKGMRLLFSALFILIILVLILNVDDFNSGFKHEINYLDVKNINTAWTRRDGSGNRVILSMTLPDKVAEGSTLAFETDHQTLKVTVGSRLLYERRPEKPWYLGHEIGRVWNFIHIPADSAGQILYLEIDNYAKREILTDTAMFGSQKNIMRNQLMDTAPLMIYVIVALLAGIGLFIVAFAIRQYGFTEPSSGAVYLSFLLIFLSVQIAMDSYMSQFLQLNLSIAYIIAQSFYIVLPILYMQFLRSKVIRGQLLLDVMCLLQMSYLMTALYLHFAGRVLLVHQQESMRSILMVCILVTAFLAADSLRLTRKEPQNRIPLIAVLFVDLSAVIVLLAYMNGIRDFNVFLYVLFIEIVFLGMLIYDQVRKTMRVFLVAAEARSLKKIAFEDALTGLGNRCAFDRDIGEINLNIGRHEVLGALILDMNNLKVTNDDYGHLQGDYLIASVGRLISECFGEAGRSYRLGGDEFTVILLDEKVSEIQSLLEHFSEMIETYNANHVLPINIAWGFASMDLRQGVPGDVSINRILKQADERMYQSKHAEAQKRPALDVSGA